MCVIKLKQVAGPGTAQYAIKANSITFLQDVDKIASCLPCDIDILPEMLKVVFIGNQKPTKKQLKIFFHVRRTIVP